MINVLFICIHNSARSQMAETFVNHFGAGKFFAESAGLEPGKLNPVVVEAMKEIGFDISGNPTKSVFDIHSTGKAYDVVVTVCDEASAERCPIFPGKHYKLHWGFPDPSAIQGEFEEKLAGTRVIRDNIKDTIEKWVKEFAIEEKSNL